MPPASDNALNEWKSLYTEEIQNIWNMERKELRKVAMVFHVLKQEFTHIESKINSEMDSFREKIELIDKVKKSSVPKRPESPVTVPLQIQYAAELSKSPKLNKSRKGSYVRKLQSSPSLLDICDESRNKKDLLVVPETYQRPKSEELFNSSSCDSSLNNTDSITDTKLVKSDVFKTPQGIKRLASVDVVDSSFIVEDTPTKVAQKKIKWTRKQNLKESTIKKLLKNKENKSFPDGGFPNQISKINLTSDNKSKNPEQVRAVQNKLNIRDNLDDETFLPLEEENCKDISNRNILITNTFFRDYDKIPVQKSTGPQHAHKTEIVRCKADRLKLPGWSCNDCEQYYKGLDLSPEELRRKMNICSKHRNKFPLLDTTPQGFWDITMPPTQENDY